MYGANSMTGVFTVRVFGLDGRIRVRDGMVVEADVFIEGWKSYFFAVFLAWLEKHGGEIHRLTAAPD